MKFTDSKKEESYLAAKNERLSNIGQRTQEIRQNTFNIVSHEGPERKFSSFISNSTSKSGLPNRRYHIINNLNIEDSKNFPILCNENLIWEKIKEGSTVIIPEGKNREFNVVSNKFYKNDEEKRREEYEATKEHVLKKYWDTHDYNPIKAKYYDEKKEKIYQEQRHVLEKVQGAALALKIPPSMQFSEGKSYNILNHSIYDENKLKSTMTVQNQALNRMKVLQVEERIKTERELKAAQAEAMKNNKVSFKRWENQVDRGFNMITNVLDSESGAYTLPAPPRPLSMWARLNDPGSGQGQGQGQGRLSTAPVSGGYRDLSGVPGGLNPSLSLESLSKTQQQNEDNNINYNYSNGNNETDGKGYGSRRTPSISSSVQDGAVSPLQSFRSAAASSTFSFSSRQQERDRGSREGPKGLPALDLSRAEQPEKVSYREPASGPSNLPIPMVRTGGLSAYRD